jgi:hypothetical protein
MAGRYPTVKRGMQLLRDKIVRQVINCKLFKKHQPTQGTELR